MGATNKELYSEITTDIITGLRITDINRTKDSIRNRPTSTFDSKEVSGKYKVEIQYQEGKKQTFAVVQVISGASDADKQSGLSSGLKDGRAGVLFTRDG